MYHRQAIQVQTLLRQAGWLVIGLIAAIVTLTIVFKGSIPNHFLYSWLAVGLLIHIVELIIVASSFRFADQLENPFWKWAIHLGCIFTGIYFASCLAFLPFADSASQVVVLVIVYALILASLFTGSAYYLMAYYLIVPPLLLPVFFLIYVYGDSYKFIYLVTLTLLIIGMHSFITGFNKIFNKLIDEQERAAKLLETVSDERDRANKAMLEKNNFLALASHDLRQPVHAIGLFVASLERHVDEERGKQILQRINTCTKTMGTLFGSILDISKLDAKAVENFSVVNHLSQFLEGMHPELEELALEKGLKFEIDCNDDLYVLADPVILHRIVANLVTNAIKFSEQGTVSLLAEQSAGTIVKLSVIDNGIGISSADIETIFSEYHQLEKPTRDRQAGLGLGLAIVKRLCELADIDVTVQSIEGQGSTFTLLIPQEFSIEHAPSKEVFRDGEFKGCSVLIVDDEPEILSAMAFLLEQWGCKVTTASSVDDAFAVFSENESPEVIIADFRLNDRMSGIQLIQEYRNRFSKTLPAILITGDTAPAFLQDFHDVNVPVLYKPVMPQHLLSGLEAVFSK